MQCINWKYGICVLSFLLFWAGCRYDGSLQNQVTNSLSDGIYTTATTELGTAKAGTRYSVSSRMNQLQVPGMSIAVIDDYAVHEVMVFGKRDSIELVKENTVFQAASVSKFVSSVIVQVLVDRGEVGLDKDINAYLHSWKMPVGKINRDHPVTLRHLLTHQSGLPATNLDFVEGREEPTLFEILDAEGSAINKPAVPVFIPGSAWEYSNIGFALVQLILEDITGASFESIAQKLVFSPMKMTQSTFSYPLSAEFAGNEAMPFNEQGEQMRPQLDSPAKAQGGLLSTPRDLARLCIELMQAFAGRSDRYSQDMVQRLFSKELELPFKFYGYKAWMGQGVLLVGEGEGLAFLHNGYNTPGATCIVIGFPYLGKGAVVAANGARGEQLYVEVLATLAAIYHWPIGQDFRI